ncbi:MAG: hypothetical protein OEO21_05685 [Candidatus Krumholzibacteria bacterium]|nr:hypothetical protein [Candidatus Krumholzibacteria bacterium]
MHCAIACALLALPATALARGGRAPLVDAPVVWHEDDRRGVAKPAPRDPSVTWDYFEDSWGMPRERWTDPVRLVRRAGTLFGGDHVPPADNVNALDEVPNSTWFTNRIGLFAMTPRACAEGPGGEAPARGAPWTVVSAKTQGVTPGFNVRDARGDVYVIKFDPPGYLGMTTAAGVASNRILYAAGYNVPVDHVVTFARATIVVAPEAKIRDATGAKRPMTEADVDTILARVERLPGGTYLALASKFLPGEPLGPFPYLGRRKDDSNDRVDHENRRELRGLYVLAAWINHFDTKQQNSLDMYVEEGGARFVKHYLIDFASTLGASANYLSPRFGYEFNLDMIAVLRRSLTLGLVEDRWRKRTRDPGLTEVGYFDSERFEPGKFRPLQPNHAFANTTDRDGYWGAKIVAAFRDAHIDAIVAEAGYRDARAAALVARVLRENRDAIARHFFDRVPPLDFFVVRGERLVFRDLGADYAVYPGTHPRYRARAAAAAADRKPDRSGWSEWVELAVTELALTASLERSQHPFLAVEVQVDRGSGWSEGVTAYVARGSARVVAVDR